MQPSWIATSNTLFCTKLLTRQKQKETNNNNNDPRPTTTARRIRISFVLPFRIVQGYFFNRSLTYIHSSPFQALWALLWINYSNQTKCKWYYVYIEHVQSQYIYELYWKWSFLFNMAEPIFAVVTNLICADAVHCCIIEHLQFSHKIALMTEIWCIALTLRSQAWSSAAENKNWSKQYRLGLTWLEWINQSISFIWNLLWNALCVPFNNDSMVFINYIVIFLCQD